MPTEQQAVAEWLGYTWIDELHVKDKEGNYVVDGTPYNPWRKHEQYTKVWKQLNYAQQVIFKEKLANNQGLFIHDLVQHNLPRVMDALWATIQETEGGE